MKQKTRSHAVTCATFGGVRFLTNPIRRHLRGRASVADFHALLDERAAHFALHARGVVRADDTGVGWGKAVERVRAAVAALVAGSLARLAWVNALLGQRAA